MNRFLFISSSFAMLLLALSVAGCGGDAEGTSGDATSNEGTNPTPAEVVVDTPEVAVDTPEPASTHEHAHGPHGGGMACIGDHIAHLEIVHDANMGQLTAYLLDPDNKALAPDQPPVLNLMTDEGSVQLKAESFGGAWLFEDDVLLDPIEKARFRVVLGGKSYTPDMPCDGAHGGEEDPGHTHGDDRTGEDE